MPNALIDMNKRKNISCTTQEAPAEGGVGFFTSHSTLDIQLFNTWNIIDHWNNSNSFGWRSPSPRLTRWWSQREKNIKNYLNSIFYPSINISVLFQFQFSYSSEWEMVKEKLFIIFPILFTSTSRLLSTDTPSRRSFHFVECIYGKDTSSSWKKSMWCSISECKCCI